eukprot:2133740-Pyramimonas_sp.AAC.1
MIADPLGIAPPSPSGAHQPAPAAAPAAGSKSASASSAQQLLAPTPGATPAGLAAVTAALIHSADEFADPDTFDEEAIVRAMVGRSTYNQRDKNWLISMACCGAALRPITAELTQRDWSRPPIFNDVRVGVFIL